jgi:hypothetical protein
MGGNEEKDWAHCVQALGPYAVTAVVAGSRNSLAICDDGRVRPLPLPRPLPAVRACCSFPGELLFLTRLLCLGWLGFLAARSSSLGGGTSAARSGTRRRPRRRAPRAPSTPLRASRSSRCASVPALPRVVRVCAAADGTSSAYCLLLYLFIQAAIGGWHCLAVDDKGRAYAWGRGTRFFTAIPVADLWLI